MKAEWVVAQLGVNPADCRDFSLCSSEQTKPVWLGVYLEDRLVSYPQWADCQAPWLTMWMRSRIISRGRMSWTGAMRKVNWCSSVWMVAGLNSLNWSESKTLCTVQSLLNLIACSFYEWRFSHCLHIFSNLFLFIHWYTVKILNLPVTNAHLSCRLVKNI